MGSLLKDSVVSFFKIMIDDDFLNVLYLPPKFARTTRDLLNKKTYLENLNGRRWNVEVCEENGSLAFRKGWLEFSKAHNLGIGDLVLFHYYLGQYFVVQVFNRTACDLRGSMLGNGYPSTRSQTLKNSVEMDGPIKATTYENSGSQEDSPGKGDSNGSVVSASVKEYEHTRENKNVNMVHPLAVAPLEIRKAEPTYFEDPEVQFIMNRRDASYEERTDRTVIDLSSYEMPSADVRPLSFANTVGKCKVEPDMTDFVNPKQEVNSHVGILVSTKQKEVDKSLYSDPKKRKYDAPILGSPSCTTLFPEYESDMKKKIYTAPTKGFPICNNSDVKKKIYDVSTKGSLSCNESDVKKKIYDLSTKGPPNCNESDVKKKIYDVPTIGSPSCIALSPKCESDVNMKIHDESTIGFPSRTAFSPKCESDVTEKMRDASVVKIRKELKTGPVKETGLALVTASASSDLHCTIRNPNAMFLELPGGLPSWQDTSCQKLIILRDYDEDQSERIWPVFYHHKPTMKVFTTGWPAFMKANNIQSGDECIFKADTKGDATYDVSIVRKSITPTSS